jgi:NodT family efflux transporter outer membrane factor (OMF) lipoprotein
MIRVIILGSLLLVSGCAVGPDYERPDLEPIVPEGYEETPAGETPVAPTVATADALPADIADPVAGARWRWWEAFGDTTLNGLVLDALEFNPDLAAAAGRVLEARALLGGAQSAQWPTVEIGGTASRSQTSEQLTGGMVDPYGNYFDLKATLRYEIDLWGKLSRGKEAAYATLVASEQDRRAVAQGLIAEVVRTWLEIRELQLQVALTERTITNFEQNLITVRDRYRRGLVSALDVHLASQNLAAAQSAEPAFRLGLAGARRRLEILAGQYPAGTITASDLDQGGGVLTREVMPDPLPPVPAGLPSDLLDRRPDLQAAEMRLHSSTARIGEAKSYLYPSFTLTASGGSTSNEFSEWFTSPSDVWSLAANLFMPLINRGQTQAQIKAAEARTAQALAGYQKSLLTAFGEVQNALDQDLYQARQEVFLADSAEMARRSVEVAQDRYRRGLDSLLVTLESQRRLFNAESQLLTTQRERRAARVNLIQALGGPWETAAPDELSLNETTNQGADQ